MAASPSISCHAGSGQPQQTVQAQPTPKRTWVVHKEYEFAVEVTSGPPTSVFCHTKARLLSGTIQYTYHHGLIAGKQRKLTASILQDVLGIGDMQALAVAQKYRLTCDDAGDHGEEPLHCG